MAIIYGVVQWLSTWHIDRELGILGCEGPHRVVCDAWSIQVA